MRALILVAFLFSTQAFGQGGTIIVTVPTDEGVAVTISQCGPLRLELKVHDADWNLPMCASMITRGGVRLGELKSLNAIRQSVVNTCTSAANAIYEGKVDDFDDIVWPVPFTPNTCGDGIVFDTEECDGGGETATCNINCTDSACGDDVLNVTAGEQCDPPGEGCSATCQNE